MLQPSVIREPTLSPSQHSLLLRGSGAWRVRAVDPLPPPPMREPTPEQPSPRDPPRAPPAPGEVPPRIDDPPLPDEPERDPGVLTVALFARAPDKRGAAGASIFAPVLQQ
jgi:hypothetical protein